tara:strand:+ start:2563 stop:3330 length:768 start_codon:yes stop_codon:yes gene_type:complete
MGYVICIPSYGRAEKCREKTLRMLHENNIPPKSIFIFVVKEEKEVYENAIGTNLYCKLITGKVGLCAQKEFAENYFDESKEIIFLDDDIDKIDLSLSNAFKKKSLDFFFKSCFYLCKKSGSYIWGIYPIYNPFFRKNKDEICTCLNFICGGLYGIINRPRNEKIKNTISCKYSSQKEDVERSVRYFDHDKIVLRFNRIGIKTTNFTTGGHGNFKNRLKNNQLVVENFEKYFHSYGRAKMRKNGMAEFCLKKLHAN